MRETFPGLLGLDPELADRCDAQHDKKQQHDALRDGEGRFSLGWRELLQGGSFLEQLCDQDEKVQVKGNEGVDNVYLAPGTGEPTQIEGVARRRQNKERDYANPIGRGETAEWEKEPGDARRHCRRKKKCRPPLKLFPGKPSAKDDEARSDARETDEDVNEGENGQAHVVLSD